MPAPKLVFAIGSCACGGGVWHDTYNIIGPVEKVVPVNYYIPGCPPRPEAIIYGVALALGLVKKNAVPTQYHPVKFPIVRYHPDEIIDINGWQTYEKIEKV
jgi:Ni,Fe-hydrogenase III small subunit